MSAVVSAPVPLWDIVEESWREAEFLWGRWELALDSHTQTIDDVDRWVEERLLGALRGVVLGGRRAVEELLVPALTSKRVREATAAAHALVLAGRDGFEPLMIALASADDTNIGTLARGMQLTRDRRDPARWASRMKGGSPIAQAAVLSVFGSKRLPLPPGIDAQIDRSQRPVQLACLRLAATARADWTRPYIEWGLDRSDPIVRAAAARAGMVLGFPSARSAAGELVGAPDEVLEIVLPVLVASDGERLLPALQRRIERGSAPRFVWESLMAIGTVAAGDTCCQALDDDEVGPLAAEALCAIAGVPSDAPELTPRDDDGTSASRSDAALPQPDAEALAARWSGIRVGLHPKRRYLAGRLFDPSGLGDALAVVPTRRRHILADELAFHTGGLAHVATRSWTPVQRAQIAAVRRTVISSRASDRQR